MQDIPVGLLGYPLEHSLSPAMQNAAFAYYGLPYTYRALPVEPAQFRQQVERCVAEGFAGWNVTVPHKARMPPYLTRASADVKATGACNTVRVTGGELTGYNTDIPGFIAGLDEAGGAPSGSVAVLLGAGGAARAVAWALASAGYPVTILSRDPEQAESIAREWQDRFTVKTAPLNYENLARTLGEAGLLVNCTPAGMWPHDDETPLPEGTVLEPGLLVYDLVYRPRPTRLLEEAAQSGCRTQDGLAMLVHQGAAAFEIWTGMQAPVSLMRYACLEQLQRQKVGTD